jgi:hypothetical protein
MTRRTTARPRIAAERKGADLRIAVTARALTMDAPQTTATAPLVWVSKLLLR